ncbi:hypothetical protein APHAL10511_006178 [Amanita phalloides]|nr:hypothetical protein APHAL10511_006178 [Amanita phalloides]
MPELPEVQHAVNLLISVGAKKRICKVDTTEDSLVFAQTTPEQFAAEIVGRTIQHVHRYGKLFYLELDGEGKVPVLHFGMTGKLQVKGKDPMQYQSSSRDAHNIWPPRYAKFILHLANDDSDGTVEVAFVDMRRLGRIRLCMSPKNESPISELGFDPILSMPTLDDFLPAVRRRTCPAKVLLLDQSFSAGVGNWIADEVLYNARIHPEQRCNTLTHAQISSLHHFVVTICETAVAVDADSQRFPAHWLFRHRWGKGRKKKMNTLTLEPNGEPATVKWITVGGRTSAYVVELQQLPSHLMNPDPVDPDGDGDIRSGTPPGQADAPTTDNDPDGTQRRGRKRRRK